MGTSQKMSSHYDGRGEYDAYDYGRGGYPSEAESYSTTDPETQHEDFPDAGDIRRARRSLRRTRRRSSAGQEADLPLAKTHAYHAVRTQFREISRNIEELKDIVMQHISVAPVVTTAELYHLLDLIHSEYGKMHVMVVDGASSILQVDV